MRKKRVCRRAQKKRRTRLKCEHIINFIVDHLIYAVTSCPLADSTQFFSLAPITSLSTHSDVWNFVLLPKILPADLYFWFVDFFCCVLLAKLFPFFLLHSLGSPKFDHYFVAIDHLAFGHLFTFHVTYALNVLHTIVKMNDRNSGRNRTRKSDRTENDYVIHVSHGHVSGRSIWQFWFSLEFFRLPKLTNREKNTMNNEIDNDRELEFLNQL